MIDNVVGRETVIEVQGLTKSFGDHQVLRGIDFIVRKGDIVSILGQSGGGKSTFIRCLNLLEVPDGGAIEMFGRAVLRDGHIVEKDLAGHRKHVGMVFQRFNLFPHLTAVENVIMPQMTAGVKEDRAIATATKLLDRVGLGHRFLAYPHQMSGGEQQRVAIARALALKPDVLLFDEPTSSLDPESTIEVLNVMSELAAEGITMVVVTHEIEFAKSVSTQVAFMSQGVVVEHGDSGFLSNPVDQRTRQFLGLAQ